MHTYTARQQTTLEALAFIIGGRKHQEDDFYHLIAEQSLRVLLEDLFVEISLVLAASCGGKKLTSSGSGLSLSVTADCAQTVVSVTRINHRFS